MEKELEERELITSEEDMDENDTKNNENKKYDEARVYYVYEHIRLDKMEPFYIGKGKGERAYDLYRNDHHDAITDEYGHAIYIPDGSEKNYSEATKENCSSTFKTI